MRKFVKYVKEFPNRLKSQWKSFFASTHNKVSEGATERYKSQPHAHGDNWRRPDAHNKSDKHHNQPPKHHKG